MLINNVFVVETQLLITEMAAIKLFKNFQHLLNLFIYIKDMFCDNMVYKSSLIYVWINYVLIKIDFLKQFIESIPKHLFGLAVTCFSEVTLKDSKS